MPDDMSVAKLKTRVLLPTRWPSTRPEANRPFPPAPGADSGQSTDRTVGKGGTYSVPAQRNFAALPLSHIAHGRTAARVWPEMAGR